jgi:hypothetical protein
MKPGFTKRGPVVEVDARRYSEPIPDALLAKFDAAGLVLDDSDHAVIVYRAGRSVGSVWGPAVEGDWFAATTPDNGVRVATRDDALTHLLDTIAGASS